jgi:hypothetical protein
LSAASRSLNPPKMTSKLAPRPLKNVAERADQVSRVASGGFS